MNKKKGVDTNHQKVMGEVMGDKEEGDNQYEKGQVK